ncbi:MULTISPECIES: hypothetical protein [Isoptericola]|uniref:Uncharacterized protein n=1 Tax=Isoptericola sediminis TaxID=2733572 RepID=A0A849K380_9MICO|nr:MULTISPECIES: hypothetical protein [Isoptericola]MDO8143246.1 hypothetical protein [Isoptericola sp. 178]MDO8147107.1 hypothetical protein [Isoptericola sp. b515]MDO8150578.1 hypothetical protein [Isoptericola sp. b408]NNU26489.1 hypothetical protein [Isoptericola sediminis]
MDKTRSHSAEVADPDEVVDELIAYDAAEVRRATVTTQSVPVATVGTPGILRHMPPEEFTD